MDFAKIQKERGEKDKARQSIIEIIINVFYILKYTDDNNDIITESLNLKYSIFDFNIKNIKSYDLFYLAQKPCNIHLTILEQEHIVQVKKWHNYFYIECDGKRYENIAILFNQYTIQDKQLIYYEDSIQRIKVEYPN